MGIVPQHGLGWKTLGFHTSHVALQRGRNLSLSWQGIWQQASKHEAGIVSEISNPSSQTGM